MKAMKWPRLRWRASQGVQRLGTAFLLMGQVIFYLVRGRIALRNLIEQMALVGPASLSVALITAAFCGHGIYDSSCP